MSFLTPGLARSGIIANRKDHAMTDTAAPVKKKTLREENIELNTALAIIADALYEEAQEREWCSEYDDFVRKVNRRVGREVLQPMNCDD